jgi:hypothetical protein
MHKRNTDPLPFNHSRRTLLHHNTSLTALHLTHSTVTHLDLSAVPLPFPHSLPISPPSPHLGGSPDGLRLSATVALPLLVSQPPTLRQDILTRRRTLPRSPPPSTLSELICSQIYPYSSSLVNVHVTWDLITGCILPFARSARAARTKNPPRFCLEEKRKDRHHNYTSISRSRLTFAGTCLLRPPVP